MRKVTSEDFFKAFDLHESLMHKYLSDYHFRSKFVVNGTASGPRYSEVDHFFQTNYPLPFLDIRIVQRTNSGCEFLFEKSEVKLLDLVLYQSYFRERDVMLSKTEVSNDTGGFNLSIAIKVEEWDRINLQEALDWDKKFLLMR